MAGTDDPLRALPDPSAADDAGVDRSPSADDGRSSDAGGRPAPPPVVSLMITNRQRADLRARGVSDETIRSMTPAEAHARLGLIEPCP